MSPGYWILRYCTLQFIVGPVIAVFFMLSGTPSYSGGIIQAAGKSVGGAVSNIPAPQGTAAHGAIHNEIVAKNNMPEIPIFGTYIMKSIGNILNDLPQLDIDLSRVGLPSAGISSEFYRRAAQWATLDASLPDLSPTASPGGGSASGGGGSSNFGDASQIADFLKNDIAGVSNQINSATANMNSAAASATQSSSLAFLPIYQNDPLSSYHAPSSAGIDGFSPTTGQYFLNGDPNQNIGTQYQNTNIAPPAALCGR